jgi:hypothetical protein
MRVFAGALLLAAFLTLPVTAEAQDHELGILGGGIFPLTGNEIEVDPAFAAQSTTGTASRACPCSRCTWNCR